MSKKALAGSIIILLLIVGAAWYLKFQTNKVESEKEVNTTEYVLLTEKDNGREGIKITQGSVVIIQLPKAQFGEPISITDASGKAIDIKRKAGGDSMAFSFAVQSDELVSVRVAAQDTEKEDFTLTIEPEPGK